MKPESGHAVTSQKKAVVNGMGKGVESKWLQMVTKRPGVGLLLSSRLCYDAHLDAAL